LHSKRYVAGGAWRIRLALAGFALSLLGLLVVLPVFRLLVLLLVVHDFGTTPVELAAIPISSGGLIMCLLGPSQGVAAWLSRFGIVFAVIGMLLGAIVTTVILTFDGGSV